MVISAEEPSSSSRPMTELYKRHAQRLRDWFTRLPPDKRVEALSCTDGVVVHALVSMRDIILAPQPFLTFPTTPTFLHRCASRENISKMDVIHPAKHLMAQGPVFFFAFERTREVWNTCILFFTFSFLYKLLKPFDLSCSMG